MRSKQLQPYIVLDIEPAGPQDKRYAIADVQVSRQIISVSEDLS